MAEPISKLKEVHVCSYPNASNSQKTIGRILTGIITAAKSRNILIHGMFDGFVEGAPPKALFRSVRYKVSGVENQQTLEWTVDQFDALAQRIFQLEHELALIMLAVVTGPRKSA